MNERRKGERAQFRLMGSGANCPHPEKRAFRTKADAKRKLKAMNVGRDCPLDDLKPYKCPCGAYHLAHKLGRKPKP